MAAGFPIVVFPGRRSLQKGLGFRAIDGVLSAEEVLTVARLISVIAEWYVGYCESGFLPLPDHRKIFWSKWLPYIRHVYDTPLHLNSTPRNPPVAIHGRDEVDCPLEYRVRV